MWCCEPDAAMLHELLIRKKPRMEGACYTCACVLTLMLQNCIFHTIKTTESCTQIQFLKQRYFNFNKFTTQ